MNKRLSLGENNFITRIGNVLLVGLNGPIRVSDIDFEHYKQVIVLGSSLYSSEELLSTAKAYGLDIEIRWRNKYRDEEYSPRLLANGRSVKYPKETSGMDLMKPYELISSRTIILFKLSIGNFIAAIKATQLYSSDLDNINKAVERTPVVQYCSYGSILHRAARISYGSVVDDTIADIYYNVIDMLQDKIKPETIEALLNLVKTTYNGHKVTYGNRDFFNEIYPGIFYINGNNDFYRGLKLIYPSLLAEDLSNRVGKKTIKMVIFSIDNGNQWKYWINDHLDLEDSPLHHNPAIGISRVKPRSYWMSQKFYRDKLLPYLSSHSGGKVL